MLIEFPKLLSDANAEALRVSWIQMFNYETGVGYGLAWHEIIEEWPTARWSRGNRNLITSFVFR
jgi:hypothetical protein